MDDGGTHLAQGYDFVDVYDGAQLIGSFSGRDRPSLFRSTACSLRIVLRTDISVGNSGFVAQYATRPMWINEACGRYSPRPLKSSLSRFTLTSKNELIFRVRYTGLSSATAGPEQPAACGGLALPLVASSDEVIVGVWGGLDAGSTPFSVGS